MYEISELTAGTPLNGLSKLIKQEIIDAYAEASGDRNPIHLDPEFGKKMQLGGTIAHGMIILAYVSEFMLVNFGVDWLTTGNMNIRFKEPARPGDNVIISGKITGMEKDTDFTTVTCGIICQNQNERVIITGDTRVRLKTK